MDEWQKLSLTEGDASSYFTPYSNVGLVLGTPSGGLIDIDLDCPQAIALAPTFLPPTEWVHGRPGAPRSHWWYVEPGEVPTTSQFRAPNGTMIVEFRSTGGQTVVPPSVNKDGEQSTWHGPTDSNGLPWGARRSWTSTT